VAELADALASGASSRKGVEVRVLSWAPFNLNGSGCARECFTKSYIFVGASSGASWSSRKALNGKQTLSLRSPLWLSKNRLITSNPDHPRKILQTSSGLSPNESAYRTCSGLIVNMSGLRVNRDLARKTQ
jgi:hypothetical protein